MAGKLFNVRLDERRLRKARRLRESGRTLADVVRDAIDQEYDARNPRTASVDRAAVVAGILARHPDPADLPPRDYDVHDAREARAGVRRTLKRRPR